MTAKFPGKIYKKSVAKSHHKIQCDCSNLCIHIKCSRINPKTNKHFQNSNVKWYCIKCLANIINSYLKLIKAKISNSRQ